MARSTTTNTAPVREIDRSSLPPMPPKILESYVKMWHDPHLFDGLEVGERGLWVAMHGEEIVATGTSHDEVLQRVEHYGPEDILMQWLEPDDWVYF
ncbi:MAG TPA: hypothetical protein VH482_26705 [Thermomicrobiales bacterium]